MFGNGNPKSGDKGSNFAYQKAVITLLNRIVIAAGGMPIPSTKTASIVRATGAGNITTGSSSFSVYNAGAANGVLLGQTIKPGEILSFSAGHVDTFGAIAYNGTGTELLITIVS